MSKRDYYEILGVSKGASKDDIRRAYRKLAHEYHPDKQGGKADKFREVNEAYEVLSDESKRSQYDRFGQTFEQSARGGQGRSASGGFNGFSGFSDFADFARGFGDNFSRGPYSGAEFDFGDIFSDIFGGQRKARRQQGVDLEMQITIDFLDSVFGTEREITLEKRDSCQACKGEGAAPGSKVVTCPKCHGQGQIITRRQTILGNFQQATTCDRCQGTGKVPEKECPECAGIGTKKQSKKIKVITPPGIDSGQRLRLSGEGEMGYRGSRPGDLYIEIRVKPHPHFKREGVNILSEVPISFYQAALGGEIEVETVDGPVMLKIPSGIQSGKVLRLSGKGVPHLETKGRGDHLITVRIVTPQKLTKKEKELLKALSDESGESVKVNKSFWDKIKDSF
ncbi:MAG: molecular chaperone DnaJ [Candidatus Doudnabacteria bacterium RIFCSPHIGHO2_02_FULL_48_21]|uniref:Chaperone protein DnaJ n=1 Tax=Candidatus Doudnabacteria bacterium RIFCSPLOWO2_02_FULL_48_13 TaxID=1817845 RepID=A0A1F5QDU0_9BACT|nr:MAG: molecular chaperone DnaJ [Candidatus Doudnabacteria bacterium RIFCSPHIGHO2_01_48_18]OGE77451.1 MAG: molecular chaperone DnaJ [Candidatus Doudnabacteria bacterium RIFCSPHIGHO2_01_FULL_48_180]OGE91570.1 MAG: molecular chaperone DnaJ [Candidatus Doudnabacteria bacterium RIFCSPHIGHO2_12_FULL_47_25]OGE93160.1 MAG: molecular chaperone DnaJ [Candidatus Doudnabacteria bacterium RIFCSPHIGHO2_02_FULL_48_21]OGE97242.1 MAG: molecular chaperone DnaJ [Candidatus Doudnabacteria bacterium RIFCSPLOWO2_0